MDTFTLAVFLILIMIAVQQEFALIGAALLLILVFTMGSRGLIALAMIGIIAGYFLNALQLVMWGMIIVVFIAVIVFHTGGRGPESYSPQMLMGG